MPIFSDDFSVIWKPVLGGTSIPTIKTSIAMQVMFIGDISAISYLTWLTGDSQSSPFTTIYFILPALAIFLREPFGRVTFYTVWVIVLFSGTMFALKYKESEDQHRSTAKAYWFISIACLVLTTFIAYITRPK